MAENPICWCCGKEPTAHVHEMTSGPDREKSLEHREAWLAVGFLCHRGIHDTNKWPLPRQLALKKLEDPDHYSLAKVNELRGTRGIPVTAAQIRKEIKKL